MVSKSKQGYVLFKIEEIFKIKQKTFVLMLGHPVKGIFSAFETIT